MDSVVSEVAGLPRQSMNGRIPLCTPCLRTDRKSVSEVSDADISEVSDADTIPIAVPGLHLAAPRLRPSAAGDLPLGQLSEFVPNVWIGLPTPQRHREGRVAAPARSTVHAVNTGAWRVLSARGAKIYFVRCLISACPRKPLVEVLLLGS